MTQLFGDLLVNLNEILIGCKGTLKTHCKATCLFLCLEAFLALLDLPDPRHLLHRLPTLLLREGVADVDGLLNDETGNVV